MNFIIDQENRERIIAMNSNWTHWKKATNAILRTKKWDLGTARFSLIVWRRSRSGHEKNWSYSHLFSLNTSSLAVSFQWIWFLHYNLTISIKIFFFPLLISLVFKKKFFSSIHLFGSLKKNIEIILCWFLLLKYFYSFQ